MRTRIVAALGIAAGTLMALGPIAAQAQAQQVMVTRSVTGGPNAAGAVSKRSMEKWTQTLSMSDEQKQAAMALHEGYLAEHQAASKELQKAMDEIRRSFEDSNDPSVFAEKTPEVNRKFAERSKVLEKTLMADVRSLLSAEQEQAWPKVERMRRREIGMRFSAVSGDSVDLTNVVDGLKLAPEAIAVLAEPLEDYASEMDRAVQERIRISEGQDGYRIGEPIDMEKFQKRAAEIREAAAKLRDVNERHARKLEQLLPEDKRPVFADAVRTQTFPRVYRQSHTSKQLEAATKLDDLDSTQRENIAELAAQYNRELRPANDAWAAAIEKDEASPNNGVVGGAGGTMMIRMGEENGELASARKARRELDERTREKLMKILRPEQQEKLPKAADDMEGVPVMGGAGRMIVR
jgi:hypothetical protein